MFQAPNTDIAPGISQGNHTWKVVKKEKNLKKRKRGNEKEQEKGKLVINKKERKLMFTHWRILKGNMNKPDLKRNSRFP